MQIQLMILNGLLTVAVALIVAHVMTNHMLRKHSITPKYGPGITAAIWFLLFDLVIKISLSTYVDELSVLVATAVGIMVASVTYTRAVPAIARLLLSNEDGEVVAITALTSRNMLNIFLVLYFASALINVLSGPGDMLSPCLLNM